MDSPEDLGDDECSVCDGWTFICGILLGSDVGSEGMGSFGCEVEDMGRGWACAAIVCDERCDERGQGPNAMGAVTFRYPDGLCNCTLGSSRASRGKNILWMVEFGLHCARSDTKAFLWTRQRLVSLSLRAIVSNVYAKEYTM